MKAFRAALIAAALVAPTATAVSQDAQETVLACTNAGISYQVGEFACIAACHGQRRLARCDLVSERALWTYISEACPSVMIINPAWPSDWSEVPAVAAMSPIPIAVNSSAIAPEIAPLIRNAARRS